MGNSPFGLLRDQFAKPDKTSYKKKNIVEVLFRLAYLCILFFVITPFMTPIRNNLDKFINNHFNYFFSELITTLIDFIAAGFLIIIPIGVRSLLNKTEKSKEDLERYSKFRCLWKAIDLSKNNQYKESNQMYKALLRDGGGYVLKRDDKEWNSVILDYMGWNYIELNDFRLAKECFEDGIKLDPKNNSIHDGIRYLDSIHRNGVEDDIENKNYKKYAEKDIYFAKKVQFIEKIERAIDLTQQDKYEESNKIYDQLLINKNDEAIKEYLDDVYANRGWNSICLGQYYKALLCFVLAKSFNPDNESIKDGMKEIREWYDDNRKNDERKHDFQLLRGYSKGLKDPDKLLKDLGFDNYEEFLYWIVHEFTKPERQFGCGACCRALIPEFIVICEKESKKNFNYIIKTLRDLYSPEEKDMIKSNYKHYFCNLGAGHEKPIWRRMWKEFDGLCK